MDAYIKKIYDMLYSPIISPYNLLTLHRRMPSVSGPRESPARRSRPAEMQCVIPGEGEMVFYYQFDKKDYLQRIYQNTMEKKNIVFSRKKAVETAKEEYYSNKTAIGKVC